MNFSRQLFLNQIYSSWEYVRACVQMHFILLESNKINQVKLLKKYALKKLNSAFFNRMLIISLFILG